MCYGLSYKAAIGGAKSSCILYSKSTSKNTDSTDYTSYIYECKLFQDLLTFFHFLIQV